MPTPHIAAERGDIAPHVLMPGDPRRARRIAERFFDEPRLVTEVRGILGFTGTFRGRPVTAMASGMGMPSLSIYATELARFYGVERIVRVGTMGSLQPETVRLGDVVIASSAHTDSAMSGFRIPGIRLSHAPAYSLLRAAADAAEASGAPPTSARSSALTPSTTCAPSWRRRSPPSGPSGSRWRPPACTTSRRRRASRPSRSAP